MYWWKLNALLTFLKMRWHIPTRFSAWGYSMALCFFLFTQAGKAFCTLPTDTARLDTNRLLSDQPLKSPMGALLRSAILPGWGQLYNHQYTKAIFVFAGNAFLIQRVFYYHHRWRQTHREEFRNKRNTFTWYAGIAYLLTLVDAYVDAYLFGFDQAMEIEFRSWPFQGKQEPGAWVVLRFHW